MMTMGDRAELVPPFEDELRVGTRATVFAAENAELRPP
jgi:hypothetical protein